ncbi:inositol monophosphatase family protein [Stackebrandtia nassauensis]|uniref:Inositol monophosphatase n=1 Tax=Stackebrandtia nassauensis (strain DSM 44728 / CIP 108903 / NRRL B-16338 / NBRC 102104 / LLR-40K-21) TaxID=446470 RepID=D3QBH6_STANL|nr:inositol monophosphatase family protein [Stackebrandtia nassauensis]ADD42858.1 inositol monophosphatase [Stackebrandtia nassauensis DSM 44728]
MKLSHDTYQHIAALIRDITDTEALTRFGNLAGGDISEKNPGDLVTIADTRVETALTEQLQALIPGSVTVGEEACEHQPELIDALATDTPCWIIDPIDGTANYASGKPEYSCLVALAHNGTIHASWLYAPSLKLSAGAHDGQAWINNQPAHTPTRAPEAPLRVMTTHPNYTGGYRHILDALDVPDITRIACSSAGLSYIDLIQGRLDALVYTWEKPWDHATGLHIHATAGGTHTTIDGTTFRLAGGNNLPFIVGHPTAIDTITALLP